MIALTPQIDTVLPTPPVGMSAVRGGQGGLQMGPITGPTPSFAGMCLAWFGAIASDAIPTKLSPVTVYAGGAWRREARLHNVNHATRRVA